MKTREILTSSRRATDLITFFFHPLCFWFSFLVNLCEDKAVARHCFCGDQMPVLVNLKAFLRLTMCVSFLEPFSLRNKKKMSVRQANIQSLFSLSLLITAPILLLLFTSVSQSYICGKKSLSFCRQQQVEPKGVHKFLINEFKYELFTQFLCIYFILAACAFTSQQCT